MQSTERLTLEARAFPCGCHPQRRWYFSRLDIGKPRTRERIGERARGAKAERPWLAREGRAKLRMPANDRDRDREERVLVRGRKDDRADPAAWLQRSPHLRKRTRQVRNKKETEPAGDNIKGPVIYREVLGIHDSCVEVLEAPRTRGLTC